MKSTEHIGRLARKPYLAMMKQMYDILQKKGFDDLSSANSIVFQFIGNGARLTDLATMANTTKQNMKHILGYMEEQGYVSRSASSTDGRSHIYTLTKKGLRVKETATHIIEKIESDWAKKLGTQNMQQLKQLLAKLNEIID